MALFTILLGSVLTNAIPVFAETIGYSTPSSDQFQSLKDQFYVAQGRLNSVFESIFGSLTGIIAQQNAQLQNSNSHTSESSSSTSTQTVSYNNNDVTSQVTNETQITTNQTEYNTQNQGDVGSEIYVNGTSSDGKIIVHLESKVPKAGEGLPIVIHFTDNYGNEIQNMNYNITAEQNGYQVLDEPKQYLARGEANYTTSSLNTDSQVDVQVTILGIGLPGHESSWTGPKGDVIKLQIGSNTEPPSVLSISPDKPSYTFGDTTTITAELSGYGAGQYIAVTVINPSGENIISRTTTTDEHGYANLVFKIPESYEIGTYQVIATAFAGDMTYKASTEFVVEPQSPNISIVSVQATDQHGNLVTSFEKGTTGYAKVVISAQSSQTALVTVDPFDANYVSLGVGSVKTTLGAGQSEILVSFFVPKDAASGTANIYADIFSDWPSNGGTPLTGESSSTVEIR